MLPRCRKSILRKQENQRAMQVASVKTKSDSQCCCTNQSESEDKHRFICQMDLTKEDMLTLGLELVGLNVITLGRTKEAGQLEIFKTHYGRHPLHLCQVWKDLQTTTNEKAKISLEAACEEKTFVGFMVANYFLANYQCKNLLYTHFLQAFIRLGIRRSMVNDIVWTFVGKIAGLKEEKIKWPDVWSEKFIISVDGTHFRINEPRDPNMRRNPEAYSHKFNLAGVNYEIGLHLWESSCVHAKTQDKASENDLAVFRKELLNKIPEGKLVIGDKIYRGKTEAEKRVLAPPNTLDAPEVKKFKSEARCRHENYNNKLKAYACMANTFRHGTQKHQICFDAVVVLVQYAIECVVPGIAEPLNRL